MEGVLVQALAAGPRHAPLIGVRAVEEPGGGVANLIDERAGANEAPESAATLLALNHERLSVTWKALKCTRLQVEER
jgi:hypothetical protein